MPRPRLCTYYSYLIHEWAEPFPAVVVIAAGSAMTPADVRHGIRIVDSNPQTRAEFLKVIDEALSLIEATDPVRFSRVKREIRTIENGIGHTGPFYMRPLRLASVNLRYLRQLDDPVAFIASLLVHNAAFGSLYTHWVLRNARNRDRFDLVCAREAGRFLKRLDMNSTAWESLHRPGLRKEITRATEDLAESWKGSHQKKGVNS